MQSFEEYCQAKETHTESVAPRRLHPHEQAILDAMQKMASTVNGNPLLGMGEVHTASGLDRDRFDKAMKNLSIKGLVGLHYHDFPQGATEEERRKMLQFDDRYYHAVALRQ